MNGSMKRIILPVLSLTLLAACNEEVSVREVNLDSLGKGLEEKAGAVWDSTREKAKAAKDWVEKKVEAADSSRKDTLNN
jgi:hypothetical protein